MKARGAADHNDVNLFPLDVSYKNLLKPIFLIVI